MLPVVTGSNDPFDIHRVVQRVAVHGLDLNIQPIYLIKLSHHLEAISKRAGQKHNRFPCAASV